MGADLSSQNGTPQVVSPVLDPEDPDANGSPSIKTAGDII
jgi:hypothetical protein